MSAFLTDIVVGMIEDRPGSTVDDLLPDLPEYRRDQVMKAMQIVAFYKRIRCERQDGKGRYKGAKPGRYYPVERDKEPVERGRTFGRVSSVWDLGRLA